MSSGQTRTYQRAESVVFLKTNEAFGGLSNMAGGFPLRVNGVRILTSEALYQACRFPHLPDVQRLIIGQKSPMTAKMKSKPHRKDSREDWLQVRVKIMRWCLRVKLAQNWRKFSELLLETGDQPIVEQSRKDDFWGAKPVDENTLVGMNVLGRLLMELREEVKTETREALCFVEPLAIPDFLLGGEPIGVVATRVAEIAREQTQADVQEPRGDVDGPAVVQQSLFDEPVAAEVPLQTSPGVSNSGVRIADMKPHLEYKESGLPWVGKMPSHWGLIPNRGLVRRRKVLVGDRYRDFRLLSLTKQGVIVRDISTGKVKFSSDMGTSQVVRNGDFVFCLFDVPETPRTVGLSRHDGMITGAYTVFESLDRGSPEYFELFYRAMDDRKLLSPLYSGLRNTIPADRFLGTKTPQPPKHEQVAIVRFLDWANGRLERAIRVKRKTIALLNEQKQTIIHRAVARGLDPSAPLKPSGIPWLGDVPQHWETRRVKNITRILRGKFTHRPRNDPSLYDGPYPFIQTGAVAQSTKFITGYKQTLNEKGLAVSKRFPSGTLVMTIAANIGDVAILTFEACFPDSIVGFVPSDDIDRDYLYLVFLCMKPELLREAPVNTQGNLNVEQIGAMGMPFPPREEQQQIVQHAESEIGSFSTAISRLEREIVLLREYRTRLVADVVTGKLDVREAAKHLPDQAPLEPVEDDMALADEFETTDEVVAL